ncbi:MAG: hypothetical protein IJ870_03855 [Alphaproteobacteria bacterium]|nr:hypothetical protein [Alphaproteobacteria bacterium]
MPIDKEDKEQQVHMLLLGQEMLPEFIENNTHELDPNDFILKYDKGYLVIYPKDNPADRIVVSKQQLDAKKLEREAKKEHKEMYAAPTEMIMGEVQPHALAEAGDNQITYDVEKIKDAADKTNIDYDTLFNSTMEHEKTHISDHKNGSNEAVNISYNYLQKLDMCTEINATISQAAIALEQYQKTGNIDGVKLLWNCSNQQEIADYIKEHSKDKDCKEQLGALVFQGWLEKNNKVGTTYWENALAQANAPINHVSDTMAGALVDNQATLNEYHKRMDTMFKKTALGDIRKYIDVDFKIEGDQQPSQSEEFLQALTNPARNTRQATKRVEALFKEVEKADKDGVRTEKEQQNIDKKVAKLLAEKTGRKSASTTQSNRDSSVTIKISQIQSGRGR